jgi:dienelactone hydrolase
MKIRSAMGHRAFRPAVIGQDGRVTSIVLFHALSGLRPAVRTAAERFRAAGHQAVAPDLYAGETATTIDESSALFERIGWETVFGRAREAVLELPDDTVMVGFSMGAAVAQSLLDERPGTAGLVLLHSTGFARPAIRAGLPIQLHVAEPDDQFAPAAEVAAWTGAMTAAGADLEVFSYPGVGHLYTDPDLPDHDGPATALTWQRMLDFVDAR